MQAYQIHATAVAGCPYLIFPSASASMERMPDIQYTKRTQRVGDGDDPALSSLLCSPGHARPLHPYPPSHRRRR